MKADSMGTYTEQKRARMGWMPATQRPQCKTCKHVDENWQDRYPRDVCTWSCKKGDFATAPTAICNDFEARK